jgi:ABC-type oligopeptide transport system substrate-binding subunit
MKMKRNIFWLGMLVTVLVLSVVFVGCASSAKAVSPSSESNVPDIDYSKIGPDDSVILAYLDPSLVLKGTVLSVVVDEGQYTSQGMVMDSQQSSQTQIPNGTHTLYVYSMTISLDPQTSRPIPFEAAFDNVAITYKIRLATNAEKEAVRIGVGNTAYVMEEVAQKKLR